MHQEVPVRARRLNNLSTHLSAAGRSVDALAAIEEAESLLRPNAEVAPQDPHAQWYAVVRRQWDTLRSA